MLEADQPQRTHRAARGRHGFVAPDRRHRVGRRAEPHVPDDQRLHLSSAGRAQPFGEAGRLDVEQPCLLRRRGARVHDLAGGNLPDAGETFGRDVDLVVPPAAGAWRASAPGRKSDCRDRLRAGSRAGRGTAPGTGRPGCCRGSRASAGDKSGCCAGRAVASPASPWSW